MQSNKTSERIEKESFMKDAKSKVLRNVKPEEAFHFYTSIGNYTGQSAASLEELLRKIKEMDIKSLEFHLFREDFEKWATSVLDDARLAQDIKIVRTQNVVGNALRDRLYFVVSRRLKQLKRRR